MSEYAERHFPKELAALLSPEATAQIASMLREHARASLITEDSFIKIGIAQRENDPYFQSLEHERHVYTTVQFPPICYAKLRWHYTDGTMIILVTERIEASALGNRRDAFALPAGVNSEEIFAEIAKIGTGKVPEHWLSTYEREKKAAGYLKRLSPHIPQLLTMHSEELFERLSFVGEPVLSHGDLLPTNILMRQGRYWFIDWEWADLRPASYDAALFTLFSRPPYQALSLFEQLDHLWDPVELYRDAVVIALRELKILVFQSQSTHQDSMIMWVRTLEEAVRWLLHS